MKLKEKKNTYIQLRSVSHKNENNARHLRDEETGISVLEGYQKVSSKGLPFSWRRMGGKTGS